ncbi:UDP-N-acetylmuramoyl-L-alanyl-D-glutamate--2,6-diaminopimelate ligase [Notoacmeibacter sp. MSK16QG-6]|uniref:UDP-N-acetylmuramoyl-L-alanyl-D-glutamate--2, 6-diaminopimelate ligase n=1 Tax=Notoacmeibacter sp. MSK16QG-6 TaxID=2957982 RepID=UPI0020A0BEE9|nr:UDP-N-acetylmuramoyl-L-alanyl-D-glutamate--2,6-diaminopimelate ligase [Notoacmeibacter sp. MSK16QG-6]MCP1199707.1 UDP-N-acetylmuramoyl-L-alanyl-D-glutamate--2,6-diaminopimelate ligase [Notoacmeibacter sp. MSK16QG-6]
MRLADIADLVQLGEVGSDHAIAGLASDSRQVGAGTLFFAIPGTKTDGAAFAADAEKAGAMAVVADRAAVLKDLSIPVFRTDNIRRALALSAARFSCGQPETMVAVTGTAGKTSVASFVRQIWSHIGLQAASIGTTGVTAPGREEFGSLTTPDPISLHALLAELAASGVTHGAMEASSHGLEMYRLDGVRLAAGGFTNLGRDHLDFHTDAEDYHRAKMRLFRELLPNGAPAIVFSDDPWSEKTISAAEEGGCEALTVGRLGSLLRLERCEQLQDGQRAQILYAGDHHEVDLPLAGEFQMANALVAAGLAISTGSDAASVFAALHGLKGASGRLEKVGATRDGAAVYVDYAHKPEALENVLKAVRPFTTGKVVVVFGCGGDRDPGKRPIMGEIAGRLADTIIVTDDNPRSEEPGLIRAAILEAVPDAQEIGDRRRAIEVGVDMLGPGDTLVIAGKGHETGQTIKGETLPFSDHDEARQALAAQAEHSAGAAS